MHNINLARSINKTASLLCQLKLITILLIACELFIFLGATRAAMAHVLDQTRSRRNMNKLKLRFQSSERYVCVQLPSTILKFNKIRWVHNSCFGPTVCSFHKYLHFKSSEHAVWIQFVCLHSENALRHSSWNYTCVSSLRAAIQCHLISAKSEFAVELFYSRTTYIARVHWRRTVRYLHANKCFYFRFVISWTSPPRTYSYIIVSKCFLLYLTSG